MAPRAQSLLQLSSDSSQHSDDSTSKDENHPTTVATTTAESSSSPILAASRHLLQANGSIIGDDIAAAILPLFPTLLSAIPTTSTTRRPALSSLDGRPGISHDRLVDFGTNEFGPFLATAVLPGLHLLNNNRTGRSSTQQQHQQLRIALILPNGPELAVALVVTAQYATAVPLNANAPATEWTADLLQCGADLVIGMSYENTTRSTETSTTSTSTSTNHQQQDWSAFRSVHQVADQLGIPYCGLIPSADEAGIFRLVPYFSTPSSSVVAAVSTTTTSSTSTTTTAPAWLPQLRPNGHQDAALVLFTSGTTGQKKLVPHILADLLTAATTIALSWQLRPDDVNLNMMPLFHIGGIVRQILAPLVSGSGVICCPSFDPSVFWTLLHQQNQQKPRAFTWYYAAPTMHQLILQTGKSDGYIKNSSNGVASSSSTSPPTTTKYSLRMIANAAGGLLPSLAEELKQTFHANVSFVDNDNTPPLLALPGTATFLLDDHHAFSPLKTNKQTNNCQIDRFASLLSC
jgi:AMP-binding enzyme